MQNQKLSVAKYEHLHSFIQNSQFQSTERDIFYTREKCGDSSENLSTVVNDKQHRTEYENKDSTESQRMQEKHEEIPLNIHTIFERAEKRRE
jgi:hypothetical protein